MTSNLVLIGYRGTGKSTIARILGERLHRDVVSLDEEIVRTAGMPIPRIVEQSGWPLFRDMESAEVRKASARADLVIDAGGGVVLRPENVAALKNSGVLILLTASIPTIASRIGSDANRPSLTGKSVADEIATVLSERNLLYHAAADGTVATDDNTPDEAAVLVEKIFRERSSV